MGTDGSVVDVAVADGDKLVVVFSATGGLVELSVGAVGVGAAVEGVFEASARSGEVITDESDFGATAVAGTSAVELASVAALELSELVVVDDELPLAVVPCAAILAAAIVAGC